MSGPNNVVESFLGAEDRAPSFIPAAESNTTLGEAQSVSSEAYAHRLLEADLPSRWGTDRRTTGHGSGASEHTGGSSLLEPSRASSSSAAGDHMLGATEHMRWNVFEGVLAFSNIGLPGAAVTSPHWPKHSMCLRTLVSSLFTGAAERGRTLTGILFNEVGNLSDPVGFVGRQKLHDVLKEAFRQSGGEDPRMLWSAGETMAAFRPGAKVECLPGLINMPDVASWRTVERFALSGATEHGPCKLLLFNQHQPQSKRRPFRPGQQISFCKAVLRSVMRYCAEEDQCIGFVFGGDANIRLAPWKTAFADSVRRQHVDIHPGPTRRDDAKVRITCEAANTWLGNQDTAMRNLQAIPPHLQYGRQEAFQRLNAILRDVDEGTLVDITTGAIEYGALFPYWLWLANQG